MKKGFTILELLVVVAILGVIASFVVVRMTGVQASARDSQRMSDIRQYQNALEIWSNSNGGLYPAGSPAVDAISLCSGGGSLSAYRCTNDPTVASGGTPYRYSANAARTAYVLWATLERNNQIFYVCSSGVAVTRSATGWTAPSNGVCP